MQQLSQPVNIPNAVSQLISSTSNLEPEEGNFQNSVLQGGNREAFFTVVASGYR